MRNFPIEKIQVLPQHHQMVIPADYIDIFGHMNVQFYMALFNDSIFAMFAEMDMDIEYFQGQACGVFAAEHHLKYFNEVHAGADIALYSRILARSEKRLHFMHFMVNHTEKTLASTLEAVAVHVDTNKRRSTPYPVAFHALVDTRLAHESILDWNAPLSTAMHP
ncbi:MAG: thioesterase family protein [Aggregatilineales bacterium]